MFEKEAEEYERLHTHYEVAKRENGAEYAKCVENRTIQEAFQQGAEFGYNKAKEWFDAKTSIPLPKKAEIYRYTLEVISDKGDIVCYDYKDKDWKKLVVEDEKVTYVPVEVVMWCNKPTKEI